MPGPSCGRSIRAHAALTDPAKPRVVVGGVAHLYQGDLDFGRVAIEQLRHEDLGDDVVLEEFSYGAVAVAQRLQELAPELLVLVGAKERGREPGAVERRDVPELPREAAEIQAAVSDAITGYIDLDLVLEVANGLGGLPRRVITIELEPVTTNPSVQLSPQAEAALTHALKLIRAEL